MKYEIANIKEYGSIATNIADWFVYITDNMDTLPDESLISKLFKIEDSFAKEPEKWTKSFEKFHNELDNFRIKFKAFKLNKTNVGAPPLRRIKGLLDISKKIFNPP